MQLTTRTKRHLAGALVTVLVALTAHVVADDKWRLALDTLVYTDSDNVVVVTPTTSVRYLLDDQGGEVRARVGVDAVSAASVDLVAQATRHFDEARTEANLGISKAFGDWVPSLDYRLSYENDYMSNGGHIGLRTDIDSPDTTLQVGYSFNYDIVGRTGSLWQYNQGMASHRADASLTQVLDKDTLLRGIVTLTASAGYMAKPYRFVPLFDQAGLARAQADGVRLSLSNFATYELGPRAPEQTPYDRVGAAFAGRIMHYLDAIHGSIRFDYQLFVDTWGLVSNMLEPAITFGPSTEWMIIGYARLYFQTSVWFWQREYTVDSTVQPLAVPTYRTLDRELSQLQTYTVGLRVEWRAPDTRFGIYGDAAVAYTNFDQFLYLDSRTALIAQAGLRWTP